MLTATYLDIDAGGGDFDGGIITLDASRDAIINASLLGDPNDTLSLTASDALFVLRRAVGVGDSLNCPACPA